MNKIIKTNESLNDIVKGCYARSEKITAIIRNSKKETTVKVVTK